MSERLTWTKSSKGWFAIYGKFRAEIRTPETPPLFMYHWSVRAGDRNGGSGATGSLAASKRSAEAEVARFAAFLSKATGAI